MCGSRTPVKVVRIWQHLARPTANQVKVMGGPYFLQRHHIVGAAGQFLGNRRHSNVSVFGHIWNAPVGDKRIHKFAQNLL